jgi:hypothetical protein
MDMIEMNIGNAPPAKGEFSSFADDKTGASAAGLLSDTY